MLSIESKGEFKKTDAFLKAMSDNKIFASLDHYGDEGVRALSSATPTGTGKTAMSWSYEVLRVNHTYSIIWNNSNVIDGVPIAILIQLGHGTRTGGYVQGRDFINPALRPIFDKIANDVWKEVTKA